MRLNQIRQILIYNHIFANVFFFFILLFGFQVTVLSCLSFDLSILITPFVSSNSFNANHNNYKTHTHTHKQKQSALKQKRLKDNYYNRMNQAVFNTLQFLCFNLNLLDVSSKCNLAACFSHRSPPGSGIPLINLYGTIHATVTLH